MCWYGNQGDFLHCTGCALDVLALLPEAASASLEDAPLTRRQPAARCSIEMDTSLLFGGATTDRLLLVAAFSICGLNKEGAWTMDGLLSRFSMPPTDKYKF